jgi:hypothetical protein
MCDHDAKATGQTYVRDGRLEIEVVCEGCGEQLAAAVPLQEHLNRPQWPPTGGPQRGNVLRD